MSFVRPYVRLSVRCNVDVRWSYKSCYLEFYYRISAHISALHTHNFNRNTQIWGRTETAKFGDFQPVSRRISETVRDRVVVTMGHLTSLQSSPSCYSRSESLYRVNQKKYPNTKITISQKSKNIFVSNFARLFSTQLCKSLQLCAVFTWHTPNWRKRKLQQRILQLYRLQKADFITN